MTMAEWLKRVMEEADRQFEQLPEWKKASAEQFLRTSTNDEVRSSSTIREPLPQQEKLR
jgi:hypothetical protein